MIIQTRLGGRRVELYIPFDAPGVGRVDAVTFGPWKFDHTLRWKRGEWLTVLDLMVDLSDRDEEIIRELREPDATRVIGAFMELVPPDIRQEIAEGINPAAMTSAPPQTVTEVSRPPGEPEAGGDHSIIGFDLDDDATSRAA